MVNKIKVASDARSSRDFLILARTDARTSYGVDEAIHRGEAYARAGADAIFIELPESVEEMKKIGAQPMCPWCPTNCTAAKLRSCLRPN